MIRKKLLFFIFIFFNYFLFSQNSNISKNELLKRIDKVIENKNIKLLNLNDFYFNSESSLFFIPKKIEFTKFENAVFNKLEEQKDKNFIIAYYIPDSDKQYYILKDNLDKNTLINISDKLKLVHYAGVASIPVNSSKIYSLSDNAEELLYSKINKNLNILDLQNQEDKDRFANNLLTLLYKAAELEKKSNFKNYKISSFTLNKALQILCPLWPFC